ncbi:unnamed protein product [Gordionus sp. m RMFG-2023]
MTIKALLILTIIYYVFVFAYTSKTLLNHIHKRQPSKKFDRIPFSDHPQIPEPIIANDVHQIGSYNKNMDAVEEGLVDSRKGIKRSTRIRKKKSKRLANMHGYGSYPPGASPTSRRHQIFTGYHYNIGDPYEPIHNLVDEGRGNQEPTKFVFRPPKEIFKETISHTDKLLVKPSITTQSKKPLILFWNPVFSLWQAKRSMKSCDSYLRSRNLLENTNQNEISLPMCEITTNRSLFQNSDVVVFHPFQLSLFDLPSSFGTNSIQNQNVRDRQKYVFVSQEAPANLKARAAYTHASTNSFPLYTVSGMFDWLFLYNSLPISDFFYPYGKRIKLKPDPNRDLGIDFEKIRKRKLIAAVVSNCQCKRRLDVILELKQLLPEMDLYGKCFDNPICMDDVTSTKLVPRQLKDISPDKMYNIAKDYFKTLPPFLTSMLSVIPTNGPSINYNSENMYLPITPDNYYKSEAFKKAYSGKNDYITQKEHRSVFTKNHSCLQDLVSDYKFVISFENSLNCPDYITEKYWVWPLQGGAIPIVGGSDRKTYEKLAIPKSYLHIDDYATTRDLVTHIKAIDKDARIHKTYLEWRKEWKVGESIPDSWCDLCHQARKEISNLVNNKPLLTEKVRQTQNHNKFKKWWNGCDNYYR